MQTLADAQDLGVGMVYQDLALAPHLTVAENMFLGRELLQKGLSRFLRWQNRAEMDRLAEIEISRLGISTLRDVRMPIRLLSGGQRQVAAIARALMWTRVAILLDEPTAALGPKQVSLVLDAIRSIAEKGLSVCIIAHDIPHVLQVADRLIILRRGQVVATLPAKGRTVTEVVALWSAMRRPLQSRARMRFMTDGAMTAASTGNAFPQERYRPQLFGGNSLWVLLLNIASSSSFSSCHTMAHS